LGLALTYLLLLLIIASPAGERLLGLDKRQKAMSLGEKAEAGTRALAASWMRTCTELNDLHRLPQDGAFARMLDIFSSIWRIGHSFSSIKQPSF
jgi:hypothetical protein